MPEQVVKEAIVRCDFNHEVALNTLLNNPVKVSSSSKSQRTAAAAAGAEAVSPKPKAARKKIHVEELE